MRAISGLMAVVLATTSLVNAWEVPEGFNESRANAKSLSPTSSVKGKHFDRFVRIWLENTDYSLAAGDPYLQWIAEQGITLTKFKQITHPSQPNYVAAVGGALNGVKDDKNHTISKDVKTIVDPLEPAGISWGLYQEDMPYTGYTGDYVNQDNGMNDYVRKHNPLMSYESVTWDADRLAKCKNFTLFYKDLEANTLPQWMFITPNMTNNGHDTSISRAGNWTKNFIEPLLSSDNFRQNTLILLTFDETETYIFDRKNVFSVLLGDAVPTNLQGTKDKTKYNHYSALSTVEQNWDLGNLGKGDVRARPFF